MYTVSVRRPFIAQHFLTVPDPGPEGELHSHRYEAAVELRGSDLDEHEYLVDIDAVEAALEGSVERYRDATLNDLSEFEGRNPSAERLARTLHDRFTDRIDAPGVDAVRMQIREVAIASVSYDPAG